MKVYVVKTVLFLHCLLLCFILFCFVYTLYIFIYIISSKYLPMNAVQVLPISGFFVWIPFTIYIHVLFCYSEMGGIISIQVNK